MPTVTINTYVSDEKYPRYLGKKRQIQAEVKQLVKERLEEELVKEE